MVDLLTYLPTYLKKRWHGWRRDLRVYSNESDRCTGILTSLGPRFLSGGLKVMFWVFEGVIILFPLVVPDENVSRTTVET